MRLETLSNEGLAWPGRRHRACRAWRVPAGRAGNLGAPEEIWLCCLELSSQEHHHAPAQLAVVLLDQACKVPALAQLCQVLQYVLCTDLPQ